MLVHGDKNIKMVECVNSHKDIWRIRWDVQFDDSQDIENLNPNLVTYQEVEFNHKPELYEIKDTIETWINNKTNDIILTGFTWVQNGMAYPVWLSDENQRNYKSACDLASQTKGSILPVKFKFGDVDNKLYYTFTTTEELRNFNKQIFLFIQMTIENGWIEKDNFDYNPYLEY